MLRKVDDSIIDREVKGLPMPERRDDSRFAYSLLILTRNTIVYFIFSELFCHFALALHAKMKSYMVYHMLII